ncbi:hypothetical protein [Marivirga lumbricoides]|uniref:hypothetical protein n=1 Tax=Marivirga lumbricoides TaxID=1046115 RepID=UPI001667212D
MKRKSNIFIFIMMTSSVAYFLIQRPLSSCTNFTSLDEILNFPYSSFNRNLPIGEVVFISKKSTAYLALAKYTKAYSQDITLLLHDAKVIIEHTIHKSRGIANGNSNNYKSLKKKGFIIVLLHFMSFAHNNTQF